MTLRIGHLSTFYHTAILLMADQNTGTRLETDVEWKLFGTGPAIVEAFQRRELDLAYIGLPPAIIGIAAGAPLRCIAGGHIEGTVIVGNASNKDFAEDRDLGQIMEQFRGGKIGVPGTGSIHDVILSETLERFHLREEVEAVHYSWADELLESMFRGEVASAFGTPALAAALRRYGDGKILYPPSLLWPENPSYGIVGEVSFLEREKKLVERFLQIHEEATTQLRKQTRETARKISTYVGFIDEALVLETLKISPRYCAQLTEGYRSCTMQFVDVLQRLNYIQRKPSSEEIFDTSFIRRVHDAGDHYGEGISV